MGGRDPRAGALDLSVILYLKEKEKSESVTQSYPTVCDPLDDSPPGSSVHGILPARILEWVGSHSLLQGIFLTKGLNLSFCIVGRFFPKKPF